MSLPAVVGVSVARRVIPKVVAGGLMVMMLAVLGIGMGAPASPAGGVSLLGGGLRPGSIPNPALAEWVVKAGSLCPEIPAAIIAAQIEQESGWNPNAVSPAGAEGISQFMPGTWPSWAADDDRTGNVSPFNPADAIMAQGRFDCALAAAVAPISRSSGVPVLMLALSAYNAGLAAVQQFGGIPPYPETQAYGPAIEALAAAKYAAGIGGGPGGSAFGMSVAGWARASLGQKYVWGGGGVNGPTGGGFDCSGLVIFAVFQASHGAISLPHSSEIQATMGQPVNMAVLAPGDVIAFQLGAPGDFDHIGIYIGGGQMIHAPHTGDVVKIETLAPYWTSVPSTVRRFG